MGDEGTPTHVLVEHRKAENELEELQLTNSDKSKQRPSRTKAPNQEIKRKEPAKRIHVEENQSLDVVKSFAEFISANFTVLTESMTNSFQKLGENLNVMNDNIMPLVHWPESELSEDISEQLDVNEANEASEKHSNDEQNADESATGQAEPPSKRKKADESAAPNKFLSSLEKKANTQEATGPKINDTLASHVTSIMRQKPEEESEKNLFQKILRPENCPGLSKITVNQVIWDRVSAEARTGDVKMQRVQSALVKGTTNVALIADLVLKSSEDKDNIDITALLDKLWKLTEDSLCCLGAANWELVQRRREALKPQIFKDYAHLCAQKVKFTDSLFGDDVTKQIKDITDDNKVNDRTEWELDSLHPSVTNVIQFLTTLFEKNLSYSSLNTARSALSTIITVDGMSIGNHPLVVRFLKGVFNLRPPVPRYKEVCDVSIVLRFLKTLSPVSSLSLKNLSHKLVMLLSLVTAQRGQTLHLLEINLMSTYDSSIVFTFNKPLKQSNPRTQVNPLVLKAYTHDESLCVFSTLKEYLQRTETLRATGSQLLISFQKPHKAVSRDTISRWIRTVVQLSGINLDVYKAHSTRAASVSAAHRAQVPVQEILRKAGWSSAQTFAIYYDKNLDTSESSASQFQEAILTR
ncbi:unnamed protein product [Pocillopora meandrina]|uniref:Tyr recombinase domain-containing protein n=1 Tax=Pocillopora meandrina TaxID=46732 RepID=A0AAU9VNT0_9CNID|nr:unnamed protein product [Pocillopora meandrina]